MRVINDINSENLKAEEEIKLSLNKILISSTSKYDWCISIFVNNRQTTDSDGELLEFFYELNSFFNEHQDYTPNKYNNWYLEDEVLSIEEKDYLIQCLSIIKEMKENCDELIYNPIKITMKNFKDAIWTPLVRE